MKTINVMRKLSKFKSVTDKKGAFCYYSRQKPEGADRMVKVVDQDGLAVALPILIEKDGEERVLFHAKTIKQLVEFLDNKGE